MTHLEKAKEDVEKLRQEFDSTSDKSKRKLIIKKTELKSKILSNNRKNKHIKPIEKKDLRLASEYYKWWSKLNKRHI